MLVISPALALTLVDSLDADNPIIGWHNLVTLAGVTADDEDADYPATNLANPSTNLRWQSDTTDEQYLTFDVTTLDEVDYVGVARHNWGSTGITVSVEYPDPDNPGDWLELVPEFMPGNDDPLLMRFVPTFLSSIRIRLQPDAVEPRAAVVYIGALLVMQRKVYVGITPITMGRAFRTIDGFSEGGDYLGSVLLSESRAMRLPFANLTPAWVRETLDPFLQVCKTTPVFVAWRPDEYPDEVGFAITRNTPQPSNQRNNGMMSIEFEFGGVA